MKSHSESYKAAGVDITAGYKAVELMKEHIAKTMSAGVMGDIGGFGGLFELDMTGITKPVLVSGTDGVGTKLKLAFLMDKHDTVGIDCVAMCVNDIICVGAKPLFFLDYIAVGKNFPEKIASIVSGVAEGCVQSGAALIGGALAGSTSIAFRGKNFKTTANDGLTLFNTGHTSITGGCENQSNKFTNAFTNDVLGKIESQMQNLKDDNGNILAVTPDTIIIPNDAGLKKDVFEAIGADKDPNTSNNGFNYTFGRWTVIVWAYLNQFIGTTAKPFILMSSQYNEDYGGALWYDRKDLTMKSYIDENTDDNVWKGNARWSAGFNDWRAFAVGGAADGKGTKTRAERRRCYEKGSGKRTHKKTRAAHAGGADSGTARKKGTQQPSAVHYKRSAVLRGGAYDNAGRRCASEIPCGAG